MEHCEEKIICHIVNSEVNSVLVPNQYQNYNLYIILACTQTNLLLYRKTAKHAYEYIIFIFVYRLIFTTIYWTLNYNKIATKFYSAVYVKTYNALYIKALDVAFFPANLVFFL